MAFFSRAKEQTERTGADSDQYEPWLGNHPLILLSANYPHNRTF